jgi:hypothetical protein
MRGLVDGRHLLLVTELVPVEHRHVPAFTEPLVHGVDIHAVARVVQQVVESLEKYRMGI